MSELTDETGTTSFIIWPPTSTLACTLHWRVKRQSPSRMLHTKKKTINNLRLCRLSFNVNGVRWHTEGKRVCCDNTWRVGAVWRRLTGFCIFIICLKWRRYFISGRLQCWPLPISPGPRLRWSGFLPDCEWARESHLAWVMISCCIPALPAASMNTVNALHHIWHSVSLLWRHLLFVCSVLPSDSYHSIQRGNERDRWCSC